MCLRGRRKLNYLLKKIVCVCELLMVVTKKGNALEKIC